MKATSIVDGILYERTVTHEEQLSRACSLAVEQVCDAYNNIVGTAFEGRSFISFARGMFIRGVDSLNKLEAQFSDGRQSPEELQIVCDKWVRGYIALFQNVMKDLNKKQGVKK